MAQDEDFNEIVKDWNFETLKNYHEFLEEKGVIQKFPWYKDLIREHLKL